MSDLEALYRAVLASPDEDMPRLMYADCVQERGDEARAKFIRAQCALARTGNPALEPMFPIQTILKANRERWEPACVTCGGDGAPYLGVEGMKTCGACRGTGRQPCRWERGFPVVQVAEMRQVWARAQCLKCRGSYVVRVEGFGPLPCAVCNDGAVWQPTTWLRDMLPRHHVAGVVPEGFVGVWSASQGDWYWSQDQVPPPVHRHCCRFHATPELATAALGRAVVLAALEWLDAQGVK